MCVYVRSVAPWLPSFTEKSDSDAKEHVDMTNAPLSC